MSDWILTKDRMPKRGQWVLVSTGNWQKPVEIKCFEGIGLGHRSYRSKETGEWVEEEYEYPAWTSGHGDRGSHNPIAWMVLPEIPEDIRKESEQWYYRGGMSEGEDW